MLNEVLWESVHQFDFDNLPESDGLYLICCECNSGNNVVIYVGQSNNIRERVLQHWGDNEKKELKDVIKNYSRHLFVMYTLFDGRKLNGVERFLYNYYNPQFSDRAPDVTPIEINLPKNVIKSNVNFN